MIGHVDSGKSTLCGRLLHACGSVDERELEKIFKKAREEGMESWGWSRLLDINEEEQVRGKTHEFNRVSFKFREVDCELIDTPGHKLYIKSMIEGISSNVNLVVVVVSMQEKEFKSGFESGMLREHLTLARGVGIKRIIIAANKMDSIGWDRKLCFDRLRKVKEFCLDLGFSEVSVIPISAYHGIGLIDLKGVPEWYKGRPLMELILELTSEIEEGPPSSEAPLKDQFALSLKIEPITTILSVGYCSVAHFGPTVENVEITDIKGRRLLRSGDEAICLVRTERKLSIPPQTKVILRKGESTVACGEVVD